MRRMLFGFAYLVLMMTGCARVDLPAGFPPEVPNYAGVTAANFWADGRYRDDNPQGDYIMPAIDPANAIIVDQAGIGGTPADENPGSIDKPLKTIEAALQLIKPGSVVLIRGGDYRVAPVKLEAAHSGTAEQPVLISAYPGETVTITGSVPVSGWERREDGLWTAPLPQSDLRHWSSVTIGDRLLLNVAQHLEMTTGSRDHRKLGTGPLPEPPLIPADNVFAIHEDRVLLRLPDGIDPDKAGVRIAVNQNGNGSTFYLNNTGYLIFNRLIFREHVGVFTAMRAHRLVLRHCIFRNNVNVLRGNGLDAVTPLCIDRCLFENVAEQNIYCHSPMTIRYSLFRNMLPGRAALTAYTSKRDMYHHVNVIGNTFLHTGANIYLTVGDSVVRHNIAYTSRFVSSSGSRNVVENNFVVYDPRDKAIANVARRDIGMRMYGYDGVVRGNTFIGFSRGMLIHPFEGTTRITGNAFHGYDDYGLIADKAVHGMEITDNLFAPINADIRTFAGGVVDADGVETPWDTSAIEPANKVKPGARRPTIPQVIREAMAANPHEGK